MTYLCQRTKESKRMNILSKLAIPALCCMLLGGCDLIDYHPYDVRIDGETGINDKNIARIETLCQGKDTLRFAFMGDSQRWYDETQDFVTDVNRRDDIDFVIHGLIGNHDCLGTGEETFRAVFGNPNFAFIAGRVKFVCLNTNAIEYDYSRPIPDFDFMENEMTERADEFDRTVIAMHIRPYCGEFNNNVARVFQRYVNLYPDIQFCLAAHEHRLAEEDLFDDGIMYYLSDCMKHRNYYIFTLTPDGYEREVVYF